MTVEFRQKLLNWFCTVGLIMLATTIAAVAAWFRISGERLASGNLDDFNIYGMMGEMIIIFAYAFPIAILWHFFDLIERGPPFTPVLYKLFGYPTFLILWLLITTLYVAMSFGIGRINTCEGLEPAFHYQCFEGPAPWLLFPWLSAIALALGVAIIKAVFSTISIFKKFE